MKRVVILLLFFAIGCGQSSRATRSSRDAAGAPKARPDLSRLAAGQEAIAYGKNTIPIRDEKGERVHGSVMSASLDVGDRVMILDDDGPEVDPERLVRVRILREIPQFYGVGPHQPYWMERKDLRPILH
jgi:hypothetical protein